MRHFIFIISTAVLAFAAIIVVTTPYSTFAQTPHKTIVAQHSIEARRGYRMSNSNEVVMYLSGTTPIKDWKMSAHGLEGEAEIIFSDVNQLQSIKGLIFSFPVRNLKGDQPAMDQDAYHALKADQYKDIRFTLISAKVEPGIEHIYEIEALGNLSVAGVSREVTLKMYATIASDGSIKFTGSQALRMSDYNVERPSLFLGIIKAADEMRLTYTLIFSK